MRSCSPLERERKKEIDERTGSEVEKGRKEEREGKNKGEKKRDEIRREVKRRRKKKS